MAPRVRGVPSPTDSLACLLQKIYVGLKRRWSRGEQWPQAPSAVQWRCFVRAADRIRRSRREGYPVEPGPLVWAIFQRFGIRTYPQHFVSEAGWQLYYEWVERREHIVADHVSFAAEFDMLSHLAASRGESIERVWRAFEGSGLFTPRFVSRMTRELHRKRDVTE